MNSHKVVVGEVQSQSRAKVLPVFAEGVGQPGEPLAPLAERSILALDVRRADAVLVWVSVDVLFLRANDLRRAVAALAFLRLRVHLDVLRVRHALAQVLGNGARVRGQAVRRQLKPMIR